MPHKGVTTLESEAYVELNLASNVNGGEYSSDVAGETARWIREHGVSVPAKRGRTLRVARDCKIRMIEQIVGFRPESDLRAFGLSPVNQFGYLWIVCFEAGIATVIGPWWSHTKNAINFADSVWLALADTR